MSRRRTGAAGAVLFEAAPIREPSRSFLASLRRLGADQATLDLVASGGGGKARRRRPRLT